MKSYKIEGATRSKVGVALAALLAQGKDGEVLIRKGFSQDTFCEFLANFAHRAVTAGFSPEKLSAAFKLIAAGNASQARQAVAEYAISFEGDENRQSLGKFFGRSTPAGAPDLSLLDL